MPRSVIRRSRELLQDLEQKSSRNSDSQLTLFGQAKEVEIIPDHLAELEEYISTLDPNDCTPRMALNHLYELVQLMERSK